MKYSVVHGPMIYLHIGQQGWVEKIRTPPALPPLDLKLFYLGDGCENCAVEEKISRPCVYTTGGSGIKNLALELQFVKSADDTANYFSTKLKSGDPKEIEYGIQ